MPRNNMTTNLSLASVREEEISRYLTQFINKHGYPPSRREIADAIGVTVSTAQEHIQRMVARGLIELTPGIPRSIRFTRMVEATEPM